MTQIMRENQMQSIGDRLVIRSWRYYPHVVVVIIICLILPCVSAGNLNLNINSTVIYQDSSSFAGYDMSISGIQAANGTCFVTWSHTLLETGNTGYAMVSSSSSPCTSWSSYYVAAQNATYTIINPIWGIAPNGDLLYFYQVTHMTAHDVLDTYQIRYTNGQQDQGSTVQIFGNAQSSPWYWYIIHSPINLASDRMILPGYAFNTTYMYPIYFYSDDNATSWHLGVNISSSPHSYAEPSISILSNQSIYGLLRAVGVGLHSYQTISSDNGITSNLPVQSMFSSPDAMSIITRTVHGNQGVAWDNASSSSTSPRNPYTFGLSNNDMTTLNNWSNIIVGVNGWSNGGVFINQSGMIMELFDNEVKTPRAVYISVIKESDFDPLNDKVLISGNVTISTRWNGA
jgi:hypothetical protein